MPSSLHAGGTASNVTRWTVAVRSLVEQAARAGGGPRPPGDTVGTLSLLVPRVSGDP